MEKKKVLVVEDEIIIADNICDSLVELGYEVTEPAINYTEAILIIEKENPDIAILDIHLSGKKTGIDIAKKINENYNFPFIFLTSNADKVTLNEAKQVMPSAFLVKPFSKQELYTSIEIAISNFTSKKIVFSKDDEKSTIFVKHKNKHIKIKLNDILYLKAAHVYVEIILKNSQKIVVRGSLNTYSNGLNNNFIRVHRSYIVNINFIDTIEKNFVFIEKNQIPIGNKFKETVITKISREK
jgi:two-component system, LytTR family, response regulator LytT